MDMTKKNTEVNEKSVNSTWLYAKTCIKNILEFSQSYKTCSFQKLNNYVLKLSLLHHGETMYTELKQMVTDHLNIKVKEDALNALNNNFFNVFIEIWNVYYKSISIIGNIVIPMDVHYVEQKGFDCFTDMSYLLFYNLVYCYGYIRDHFRMSLFNLIKLKRKGEENGHLVILNACEMLMMFNKTNENIYVNDFERSFLKKSADFYKKESQMMLNEGDASIYVRLAVSRITREENLANFFHTSTKIQLLEIIKMELIENNVKLIFEVDNYSGMLFMVKNNKYNDLACMYKLLMRVDGLKTMIYYISQYLRKLGESIVQIEDPDTCMAVNCVQTLLDLRDKFNYMLVYSFKNNDVFKNKINDEFKYFFNINSKLPEYLALFICEKFKSAESNIEMVFDKVMAISRFFQEKTIFENYFKQHLANKLLLDESVSHDIKVDILSKLKALSVFFSPIIHQVEDIVKE